MWQHLVRIKCTLHSRLFNTESLWKNKQWLAFKITYLGELTSRGQCVCLSFTFPHLLFFFHSVFLFHYASASYMNNVLAHNLILCVLKRETNQISFEIFLQRNMFICVLCCYFIFVDRQSFFRHFSIHCVSKTRTIICGMIRYVWMICFYEKKKCLCWKKGDQNNEKINTNHNSWLHGEIYRIKCRNVISMLLAQMCHMRSA